MRFIYLVSLLVLSPLSAELTVPNVFSDHMVMQRDTQVPVWGSAAASQDVSIEFRDQKVAAKADDKGKWRASLSPLKAGGPDELKISAGDKSLIIKDVLVGEVWVGSGQSNMAGAARSYAKRDQQLAALVAGAPYPNLRLLRSPGKWTDSSAANAGAFSALLLSFGHKLHKELDVPVGLLVGAVGGTPSGFWVEPEYYGKDENARKTIEKFASTYDFEAATKRYEAAVAKWTEANAKAKAAKKRLPRKPNPPVQAGGTTRGGAIGGLYMKFIAPIAGYGIRGVLWDQGESGTAILGLDQVTAMGSLIAGWRQAWGQDFPFIYVQKPSGGGIAWDPANPITAMAEKLKALPASHEDGSYRGLHIEIMKHPSTYMATASDLGPGIHPTNKWGYGQRAARVALGVAYKKDVAISGPTYKSHEVKDGKVHVSFDHVGKGLAFKHGDKLQGFAIAGEDGVFQWADAVIEGDKVIVFSDKVAAPVVVRYAWARSHPWANLFNKDGLPALSFRTDR